MTQARNRAAWLALLVAATMACPLWYYARRVADADARLLQVLNNAPTAVIVCSSEGKVVYVNDRVWDITGYTAEEIQSRGLGLLIPEELLQAHNEGFTKALANLPPPGQILYRKVLPVKCKDGRLLRTVVSVGTVVHSGKTEFFAFISPVVPEEDDLTTDLPTSNFKEYRVPPRP